MRKILLLFLAGTLGFPLFAQDLVISGRLLNSEGVPVSMAQLSLISAGFETTSDANGYFTISGSTGLEIPEKNEMKSSFDGRKLSLSCQGEIVNVGIFDLTGREIASILSNQELSGDYALFPGAYVEISAANALIVRATVGGSTSSFLFVQENSSQDNRGLFDEAGSTFSKKASIAGYSAIDTLLITHALYVTKKIPIECKMCSTGDITVFELTPEAPTNLAGIAESYSTVALNWDDNSHNETGFKIERATRPVVGEGWLDFSELAELTADVTSYSDNGLIQSKSYKYRVRAFNGGGYSPYSEEVTVTTPLSNPLTLSGPSTSTGDFELTVTYSWPGLFGSTSDRFELEESSTPTGGFTKIANSTWGQRPASYIFSLSKASGTYYYRARAIQASGATAYTDVISVSVNTPVQKAYLKVVNNTRYPLVDIRLNNQQMVGQGMGVLQGDSFTFEFTSSGQVNFVLGVGYWDGGSRDLWFLSSGFTQVTVGTTTTITFNNPTIGQLLSNFSSYRDWTGEYWVNLQMHMATFRFYSNGEWELYDDGVKIDNGVVTLTSWVNNATIINFKICPGCDEILLAYPFGQFTYRNGPASWPLIQYTAQ